MLRGVEYCLRVYLPNSSMNTFSSDDCKKLNSPLLFALGATGAGAATAAATGADLGAVSFDGDLAIDGGEKKDVAGGFAFAAAGGATLVTVGNVTLVIAGGGVDGVDLVGCAGALGVVDAALALVPPNVMTFTAAVGFSEDGGLGV